MAQRPAVNKIVRGLVEFCLFQGAWFACILGAAHGHVGWGVLAVMAWVAISWTLSDQRWVDGVLAGQAVLMGVVWDTWMLRAGWVEYASPGPLAQWAPVWILALWALFATLVRGPLSWLHGRPVLAAVLGAVSGPLSYLAAVRLGAGKFADTTQSMLVLGAGWAVMTPMLTEMARWLPTRGRGAKPVVSA